MKIARYRPPEIKELPNLPSGLEWTDTLLASRDRAIGEHTQALQRRLDFANNFNADLRTVAMMNDTSVTITTSIKGRPQGVLVLGTTEYSYHKLAWRVVDTDRIEVKVKWDSTPTSLVDVTLLILGTS